MENPLLKNLNPPQLEAVSTVDGPLLVLAGAGTGKTRVLTTRLANILLQGKASPNQVLAVTFTNKAAREMGERIEKLIERPVDGMWLGTFHSLASRLLRYHPEYVGLDRNFTIVDMDDQNRLLKQILADKGIDDKRMPPRLLGSVISRWKDNAWLPDDVPFHEAESLEGKGVELYKEYQARLKVNNAVDFGDLLLYALILFRDNPEILQRYQSWFKYVLVDEYQDTNTVQYMWLRLLTMAHKNICVVGDDDQSIYGWRGAQVGNILKFEKDYPGAKVVKLEQNYRSTGNILKAAAALIKNNSERHDKTLWTSDNDGEKVEIHPVFDGREEARFVCDRIEQEVGDGKEYHDMAILLRTAAQTRPFEEQFVKNGVPYQIVGGLRFYERKEIRDAIAYLRLIQSDSDGLALERIINVPKRGVGDGTVSKIRDVSNARGVSMVEGLRISLGEGLIPPRMQNVLGAFVEKITELRKKIEEQPLDRFMETILMEMGYIEMLEQDKNKEEAKGRLENLKELVRAMQEYADVEAFLEHVSLVMDEEKAAESSVKVTTVHSAKGLEFDTVFIPGFEDGMFPHQRSLNEEGEKGIEEERRLAYVAITRAKRKLMISYAQSRYIYGQVQPCSASRFLEELPDECLHTVPATGGFSTSWRPNSGSTFDKADRSYEPMMRKPAAYAFSEPKPVDQGGKYSIGTRVFHQKFGYGFVKRQEGKGESQRLTIQFEKAGTKKLVAALANLEVA